MRNIEKSEIDHKIIILLILEFDKNVLFMIFFAVYKLGVL